MPFLPVGGVPANAEATKSRPVAVVTPACLNSKTSAGTASYLTPRRPADLSSLKVRRAAASSADVPAQRKPSSALVPSETKYSSSACG